MAVVRKIWQSIAYLTCVSVKSDRFHYVWHSSNRK